MTPTCLRLAFGLAIHAFAFGAAGAAPAAAPRPDPLEASAPVPPARHVSAFERFRPTGETAVGDWKAANDTVGRIGGWRAYAREAAAPPVAAPTPTAPASAASPGATLQAPAAAGAAR